MNKFSKWLMAAKIKRYLWVEEYEKAVNCLPDSKEKEDLLSIVRPHWTGKEIKIIEGGI